MLLVGEGDGEAVGAAVRGGAAAAVQPPSLPVHPKPLRRARSRLGRLPFGVAYGGHLPLVSVT